jgi:hypothetical protein
VASLEFALVGLAFFMILFTAMDLGRYFLTVHSLRTLTSELARATMVWCARQDAQGLTSPGGPPCTLPAAGAVSVASAKLKVPFLVAGSFAAPAPSGTRSFISPTEASITGSAAYNFSFIVPWLSSVNPSLNPIQQTTTMDTYF